MVSCLWHWGGFSGECLVQPEQVFVGYAWQPPRVYIETSRGPDLCKRDPLVPSKVNHGRVEQVGAKLVAYPVDSGSSIYRQMKPSGQRRLNNNATQLASSENAFWN